MAGRQCSKGSHPKSRDLGEAGRFSMCSDYLQVRHQLQIMYSSNIIVFRFGWTSNMQKIIQSQTHSKTQDMQRDYYLNQKKTLEINVRHPLMKELLRRVEDNPEDKIAKDMATMMFNTATLR